MSFNFSFLYLLGEAQSVILGNKEYEELIVDLRDALRRYIEIKYLWIFIRIVVYFKRFLKIVLMIKSLLQRDLLVIL